MRIENGGEYYSKEFKLILKSRGIVRKKTSLHTLEQNNVLEMLNQILMQKAHNMKVGLGLSMRVWAKPIATTNYLTI
jgi:hypothetical protein